MKISIEQWTTDSFKTEEFADEAIAKIEELKKQIKMQKVANGDIVKLSKTGSNPLLIKHLGQECSILVVRPNSIDVEFDDGLVITVDKKMFETTDKERKPIYEGILQFNDKNPMKKFNGERVNIIEEGNTAGKDYVIYHRNGSDIKTAKDNVKRID